MRATRLLQSQHQQARTTINQLLRSKFGRDRLVNELADMLAAHELCEEEIFYPVARSIQKKVIDHSVEEHDLIMIAMQRVLATPRDTTGFEARLQAVRTLFEHHVAIEENAVFPTMDQLLTQEQNGTLARKIEKRFHQVLPAGSQQILSMRQTRISCPIPGAMEIARIGQQSRRARRGR